MIGRRVIAALLACVLYSSLAGCASQPLTEQQRYQKLQDGWTYRAYRKVSKESLNPLIKTYNHEREKTGRSTIDESFAHALVGFSWSLALKPDFALAEAQLSERKARNVRERYLAHTTRSIAFYQKEWRQLASSESQFAKQLLADNNLTEDYDKKQAIAQLIVGSLAVMEGDAGVARSSFMTVGNYLDKPWLPALAQSAAYIYSNKWTESARLLKSLLQEGNLLEQERAFISDLAKGADLKDSNIKASIGRYLKQEFMQSFNQDDDGFLAEIEDYMRKVKLK